MRILVLGTDSFGGLGGIAKYNRDFLTALCLHSSVDEVVVITRLAGSEREAQPAKLTFVTSGLGSKRKFVATVLRQMLAVSSFDFVICAHVRLLSLALMAAKRYRAPLILLAYGVEVWHRPPGRISSRLCASIDGFVSISWLTAHRFRSWAPLQSKPQWIVPNAIDLDQFTPGPKDPGLIERYGLRGRTVIATLGRLETSERLKGFDEMLAVLPGVIRKHPGLVYLIMGDGSDKTRLEQRARELGLVGSVVFTGRVDESEKVRHYRLADAYVMPSHGEGFGFVFLEALACGVPVLASAIDGGREAIRGGMLGVLVDPEDRDDISRGIDEVLARPRGVVPDGLNYFAFENFVSRVHAFVDDVGRG